MCVWGKKNNKRQEKRVWNAETVSIISDPGKWFQQEQIRWALLPRLQLFISPSTTKSYGSSCWGRRTKFQTRGGASAFFSHRGQGGVEPMDRHHRWRRKWPGQKRIMKMHKFMVRVLNHFRNGVHLHGHHHNLKLCILERDTALVL